MCQLQVEQGRSGADARSAASTAAAIRHRLAHLAKPLRALGAGTGTAIRRRLRQGSSTRKWHVGTASTVVLSAFTSRASKPAVVLAAAASPAIATAPGLAVEVFDGGDSRMPIAATKVAVATTVAPCLNYTGENTVGDGLKGPLFKLLNRTLDFDLRFTGDTCRSSVCRAAGFARLASALNPACCLAISALPCSHQQLHA